MNNFINIQLKRYQNNYPGKVEGSTVPINNYSRNVSVSAGNTGAAKCANSGKSYPDIRVMYSQIAETLEPEEKILLNQLYKNGKLLSRNSNDGSSTLENLYKIVTEPRLPRFDSKNIVKSTLKTLHDPYLITQNFGRIPPAMLAGIIKAENTKLQAKIQKAKSSKNFNPDNIGDIYPIKPEDLFNLHSATCPAASIEFNLADRRPAEFVRYVEGLTGPEKSVKTRIKYSDLSPDMMEATSALVNQNSDFKPLDWENIEVTIKPDKNAYLRADVQEDFRAKNTRSMIDVLMQSAFMTLGSRKTYNTLTDRRSKEVGGGGGLNQFEIAFVESIVDSNSKKIPIVYMELDNDLTKVTKYYYTPEETRKHFVNTLDMGKNIITGFLIDVDKNGNVLTPQGHEILLTGYKYDDKGNLWFKYNDTDDGDYFAPSWIQADEFIPKVHHANVPQDVLEQKFQQQPVGYMYLQEYKALKNQAKK